MSIHDASKKKKYDKKQEDDPVRKLTTGENSLWQLSAIWIAGRECGNDT